MARSSALLGLLVAVVMVLGGSALAAPAAAPQNKKVYLPLVLRPKPWTPYYDESFGYGLNVAQPKATRYVSEMGFGWVKYHVKWKDGEPFAKGSYDWTNADDYPWDSYAGNYVRDTAPGMKILLRVDTPPAWANGGAGDQAPPNSAKDFGDFMQALSSYLKGKVAAYEIWNEPNISSEWGGRSPDPAAYTDLLKEAYRGVKAGDPKAMVITAGMATTGGGGGTAMNDVEFIDRMYQNGAKGYFDALGSHPYGFASPPETDPWGAAILFFRRAEAQRGVMTKWGDTGKQIWATEFGWLLDPAPLDPSCTLPGDRDWQKVSLADQASYLVGAYKWAHAEWPWMGPMFIFNLDFSDLPEWWLGGCDQMRWYAVTGAGSTLGDGVLVPRPAFDALKAMAKPTGR